MIKLSMIGLSKRKSIIHGFGIFAGEAIPRGRSFYLVPTDEFYNKPKARCAHIGEGKWVCDEKVLNWVNHSCGPNTEIVAKQGEASLLALRNIPKGEEITCDYNKTEINGQRVVCNCRDKSCRGYFLRIEQ